MRSSRGSPFFPACLYLLIPLLIPTPAQGQLSGLGFDFKMGYSEIGGDWGEVLNDGVDSEFNFYYGLERVRLGFGFDLVSYDLPFSEGEVDSGSQVGMQFSVAYPFLKGAMVQPYIEGRLTWDRFRAENRVEGFPPEEEEGENNAPAYSGWGGTGVAGLFIPMSGRVLLDLSARFGGFGTSEADLEYLDLPVVSSGSRWGVRVGIVWYP
jgi:hypothetical protein